MYKWWPMCLRLSSTDVFKVEFYRGNIEGRGEALEYYGAAAQIATRPVNNQDISPWWWIIMTLMIDGDAKPNDIAKVLSTQPHTQKLQYYGYDDLLMIHYTNDGDDKPNESLIMISERCCRPSRTPRSCNTMEPQRLPSAASSTRLDRSDDGDVVMKMIINHLLMMIALMFVPGSTPTEGFCWTSSRGGDHHHHHHHQLLQHHQHSINHQHQHQHQTSASPLAPWTFSYFSNRLGEGAAPGPYTCTSSPSPRCPAF